MNFLHTGEASDIAWDETEAVISPSGDDTSNRVSPEPNENELRRSGDAMLNGGLIIRKRRKEWVQESKHNTGGWEPCSD